MPGEFATSFVIFIFCVVASAFFSSSETAYTSLNRLRMENEARKGSQAAKKALKLESQYEELLSSILIGNNIVNIAASSVATVFFVAIYPRMGATIATAVTTMILLMFGEITPKLVAKLMPETLAKAFAGILSFFMTLFKPLVWIFTQWQKFVVSLLPHQDSVKVSEEELLSMTDLAFKEGSLEANERLLVRAAMKLDDTTVSYIYIPRVDVYSVNLDDPTQEILDTFQEANHTRLVVLDEDSDDVVGILHERDFNRKYIETLRQGGQVDISQLMSPPRFIPETSNLSGLLHFMQEEQVHLVCILDEFGGFEGIVTMEDILERLVGNIWDEHDVVSNDIQELTPGTVIRIPGLFPVPDLYDYFRLSSETDWDSNTVGGLITEVSNRLPETGDVVTVDNLRFTAEEVNQGRVLQCLVEKLPEPESQATED